MFYTLVYRYFQIELNQLRSKAGENTHVNLGWCPASLCGAGAGGGVIITPPAISPSIMALHEATTIYVSATTSGGLVG